MKPLFSGRKRAVSLFLVNIRLAEILFKEFWINAPVGCFFQRNQLAFDQIGQVKIHGGHARFQAGLDNRVDLVGLAFPDHITYCVIGHQDFQGGNPA